MSQTIESAASELSRGEKYRLYTLLKSLELHDECYPLSISEDNVRITFDSYRDARNYVKWYEED